MIFLSRVLEIDAFGHLGVTQSRATTSPRRKVFWACNGGPRADPSTRWRDYIPKLASCIFISVILYLTDIIHESKTNSV